MQSKTSSTCTISEQFPPECCFWNQLQTSIVYLIFWSEVGFTQIPTCPIIIKAPAIHALLQARQAYISVVCVNYTRIGQPMLRLTQYTVHNVDYHLSITRISTTYNCFFWMSVWLQTEIMMIRASVEIYWTVRWHSMSTLPTKPRHTVITTLRSVVVYKCNGRYLPGQTNTTTSICQNDQSTNKKLHTRFNSNIMTIKYILFTFINHQYL